MPYKTPICGIYKITSPSKRVYIGQSVHILNRWSTYRSMCINGQRLLLNSFKKYGVKKHKFEIIHVCEPNELDKLEQYYAELFNVYKVKTGLNLIIAGGHKRHSEETKAKISKSGTGKKRSIQTRQRISAALKGKKKSAEHVKKMSVANLGKKASPETRDKMRKAHLGKKHRPHKPMKPYSEWNRKNKLSK